MFPTRGRPWPSWRGWPAGGAGWSALVGEVFEAAGVVPLPPGRLSAHLDFPRTPEGLADLATSAGLQVVDASEHTWTWRTTPDSLWAGIAGGVATVGETYLAQDAAVRERVEIGFRERSAAMARDGVLSFPCRAVLVVAGR